MTSAFRPLTYASNALSSLVPELPELEVTKDQLRLALAGRLVAAAMVRSPVALKTVTPTLESLAGKRIRSVSRLGKVICIGFDDRSHLCVHLMLSGRFAFGPSRAPLNRLHAFALRLDRDEDLRVIEDTTHHQLLIRA